MVVVGWIFAFYGVCCNENLLFAISWLCCGVGVRSGLTVLRNENGYKYGSDSLFIYMYMAFHALQECSGVVSVLL
jgi:hypothetical protein